MSSAAVLHPGFPQEAGRGYQTGIVGMALFLMAEVMFFSGLISAFLVLRGGSLMWPPLDQPRLPVWTTTGNTAVLLASGWTMWRAWRMDRRGRPHVRNRYLAGTFLLGAIFLLVQGLEWVRLLGYGLTTTSSVYGGTFYLLIGTHGLHVLAAVVVLGAICFQARRGGLPANRLLAALMYWGFVVTVWPVLYGLVYF